MGQKNVSVKCLKVNISLTKLKPSKTYNLFLGNDVYEDNQKFCGKPMAETQKKDSYKVCL